MKGKPGRPKGRLSPHTDTVGPVRVTPEQKATYKRLGGSAWLKKILDAFRD